MAGSESIMASSKFENIVYCIFCNKLCFESLSLYYGWKRGSVSSYFALGLLEGSLYSNRLITDTKFESYFLNGS